MEFEFPGAFPRKNEKPKRRENMPQAATQAKRVVVTIAGDPDDRLFEVDVELGATPASIFAAMGLEKGSDRSFPYQLTKPGNAGVFRDEENVFAAVKPGDKLQAVPKSPVAVG